jgi:ERF superfamily
VTTVAEPTTNVPDVLPAELDTSRMTIHQLLIEARRRVRAIGKNARNSEQNYNYRGIDDVVNEASPIFADLGILVLPMLDTVGYRDVRTSRDKPAREVTLQVVYRFHGPVDYLDIKVPGESMDMGDKGTPKAMSVALRIALLQALLIPTEQLHPDPDSQSYERADTADQAATREAQQPSRDTLLSTVATLSTELQQAMGIGEYEYLDWLVKVLRQAFGVDITSKRTEDGPVEEIDWQRLDTNQLHLAWVRLRKRLNQEKAAREAGA